MCYGVWRVIIIFYGVKGTGEGGGHETNDSPFGGVQNKQDFLEGTKQK